MLTSDPHSIGNLMMQAKAHGEVYRCISTSDEGLNSQDKFRSIIH